MRNSPHIAQRVSTLDIFILLNKTVDGRLVRNSIDDLTTSLKIINVKRAGAEFHVKAAMKWLGEVDTANNGSQYRSAMLADVSGNIKLTVWKTTWLYSHL